MDAARPAATKERFKPDLPKRLAALRLSASICDYEVFKKSPT
jgi:hypothetical protein